MVKDQYHDENDLLKVGAVHFTIGSSEETIRQGHLRVLAKHLYQQDGKRTPVSNGVLDRRMGTCSKEVKCGTCGKGMVECIGHFGYVELELPVFHCGYFLAVIGILQTICKVCGGVLLKQKDKDALREKVTNANTSYLNKKALRKKVILLAKKMHVCLQCGAPNGVIKKCGMMKIAHDKFRYANKFVGKEAKDDFDLATEGKLAQLDPNVDVLNPLSVYELFKKIPFDDIPFLLIGGLNQYNLIHGFNNSRGNPVDLLLTALPVPPISIRPSVVSEIKAGTTEDDITMKISEVCFLNEVLNKHKESGGKIEMIAEDWDFIQMQCALVINSELSGIPAQQLGKKKTGRGFVQRLKGKQGRFRGNLSGKRVDFSGRSVISPDPNLRIQQVGVPVHMAKVLTYPEKVTPYNIHLLRELVINGPDVHPGANFIVNKEGTIRKFLKYGFRNKMADELKLGDIVERHMFDNDVVLFNRQPSLHRLSIMCHRAKIMSGRTLRFNECVCAPYNADFDGDEMNIHLPQTEEAKAEALTLMANEANLVTPRNGELIIAATQDFLTGAYLLTLKDTFFNKSDACRIIGWCAGDEFERIELPSPAIRKPMTLWTGKQLISLIFRPSRRSLIKLNLRAKGKTYTGKDEEFNPNDCFVVVHNSELLAGALDKSTLGSGAKSNVFYALLRDWGQEAACSAMHRLSRITSNYLMNRGFSIGIGDVTPGMELTRRKQELIISGYDRCYNSLGNSNAIGAAVVESTVEKELSDIRDSAGKLCVQTLHKSNAPLIMAQCGSKGSNINISQMIACVGQQTINGKRVPEGFFQRSLPHFRRHDIGPEAKGFVANSFFTGLSPSEFYFHAMGGREGLVDTAVKTAETGYMQRRLVKALEDLCCQYDMSVRNAEGQVIQMCYGMDGLDPMFMEGQDKPVDFDRVYLNVKAEITQRSEPYLTASQKMSSLEFINADASKTSDATVSSEEFKCDLQQFVARNVFRSKQLIMFVTKCWDKFYRAMMEPGTSVGALAAQSIGEPGTQMTLKTFHFAGVASMNVTQGVPRIKEIINASKIISTPVISASLDSNDKDTARKVKNLIQRTVLEELADEIEEVYTIDHLYIYINLNPKEMAKRNATPECVRDQLMNGLKGKQYRAIRVLDDGNICIFPPDYSKSEIYFTIQSILKILRSIPVKGIPGINKVFLSEDEDKKLKLHAEGDNFLGVLATPGIDARRSTTNNIAQMQKILGIEAARTSIIHEIQTTMQSHGMSVDQRHLTLVADLMTCRGEVLGITRHGLAKMKESVLMLASFEKTADHLFEAAYHGQKDVIAGVSESIILGLQSTLGTGSMHILEKPKHIRELVSRPLIFETLYKEMYEDMEYDDL